MERLKVNYIKELNTFHRWLQVNEIPTSAVTLWYSLIHWCNQTGWKKEFNVAMSLLENDTKMSRRTIERARAVLQEKGLIRIKQRHGNQSPIYQIIPLTVRHNDAQTDAQTTFVRHNDAQSDAQTDAQTDHIPKRKTKDRNIEDDGDGQRTNTENYSFQKIVEAYQNNIHPIAGCIERDKLVDLYNDYKPEWLMEAIRIASLNHATTIRYIEAILNKWSLTGQKKPWIQQKNKQNGSWTQNNAETERQRGIDSTKELLDEFEAEEGRNDNEQDTDPKSAWTSAIRIFKATR